MRRLAVLVAMISLGCGYARVNIVPPKLDGTAAAREQAYRDFQTVGVRVEETILERGPASPGRGGLRYDLDAIRLGNGTMVEDPRDLIPLVPGGSTERLANLWGDGRDRWDLHLRIAGGSLILGAAGLITLPLYARNVSPAVGSVLAWTSLALILLVPLVNILIPAIFVRKIDHLRIQAFDQYEFDLQALLRPGE